MNQVFISYKNTINNTKTPDAAMARELYQALTNAGINTFFAEESLIELGVDKYKEIIDKELDQCLILIVVGTTVQNISSNWVKYEWDSFYLDILNGSKEGKEYTYLDSINPHDLPRSLRGVQSFDRNRDSLQSIVKCISNALLELCQKFHCKENTIERKNDIDAQQSPFAFSKRFLHSGATIIADESTEVVEENVDNISALFDSIYYAKHYDVKLNEGSIAKTIYEIIKSSCNSNCAKNLLKIKGPLGSYKNRLLQYVYLLIEKKEKDILPFYIDFAMYEKAIENKVIDDKLELEQLVKKDFRQIQDFINQEKNKHPVVIIDGIRDFSSGQDRIYTVIKNELSKIQCKFVVSLDTDFTNSQRFSIHPLVGSNFEFFIRIGSMSIYNKSDCICFIKKCIKAFNINLPHNVDENVIYNRLNDLGVIELDAYWVFNLLTEMIYNVLNDNVTIVDLYEAICSKSLNSEEMNSAAELAFNYEYGSFDFSDSEYYFDKRWKILRKHRSVMDYLIAKYYVNRIKEIDASDYNNLYNQLHLFSMILPKSVTIFVSPMINKVDNFDAKIITIANTCYDSLSAVEKNQVIYLLRRLTNKTSIRESKTLLKKFYKEQKENNKVINEMDMLITDRKISVFLFRTICVSLIALGEKNVADEYFNALLLDKTANEVNRSFYLIYYGDTPFIPNKSLLDLSDNTSKGTKALDALCFSIQHRLEERKYSHMLLLELFTLCSLIQARSEINKEEILFVGGYALKAIDYINVVIKNHYIDNFEKMKQFFIWMNNELKDIYIDKHSYSPVKVYKELSEACTIERRWNQRDIPNPENIVEHMYRCWLIAGLYLPDSLEGEPLYDKSKIMRMLLIHDLGENDACDIVSNEKNKNPVCFDEKANRTMLKYLLSSTYPSAENLIDFQECWDSWYYKKGINFQIAKDIDIIQAIYQMCVYYNLYSNLFDIDDVMNWMDELQSLKTECGRKISEVLIINNRDFSDVLGQYFGGVDYD